MAITKITSSVVANNAIIAAGVAENSIGSSEIASNAVGTAQIASGAITTDMLDTNLDIAGTLDVTGVLTADSNVVIAGNLTVNGTTVTNSATNTTIEDALIELGTGTTGTPANDAGIVIERGDSDNAFMGWDESADGFILGTGSFTGASTGNLTISTAPLTIGALTASSLAYPTSDGTANQVLITNGSGTLSFSSLPIDGAVVDNYTATGDGSTVTFDTGLNPQDEKNTWVFVGGVYQPKSSYSYNGTQITFSEAPPNGEDIDIVSGQVAGFDSAETVLGIYTTTTTATDTYDTGLSAANENNTFVFIEGVYQPKSTYTWSGSTITFDANTPADLALEVMATKTLSASAVTTNTIAANAVTSAKIASNAILARHIAGNAIGASEIASNAQIVASTFTGALTGNVTGNVTGNLTGTIQTAAQTNITSVGTLSALTVSGDLTVDTNTLYVDSANNLVGIGTDTPATGLQVVGQHISIDNGLSYQSFTNGGTRRSLLGVNSSDTITIGDTDFGKITILSSGNVGIGTTSPSSFNAAGTGIATVSGTGTGASTLALYSGTTSSGFLYFSDGTSGADRYQGYLEYSHANNDMRIGTVGTERMRIDSSGLVRIGASGGTGQRLSINGFTQSDTMSEANAWLVAEANGGDGIAIGTRATTPYATWIQSGYLNTLGTSNHYALALNPHGGNVGIGTDSPSSELHVDSNNTDTTITIESDLDGFSLFTSGIDLKREGVSKGARIESLRDPSVGGVGLKFLTTANNSAEVSGTLTSRMVILETGEIGIGTDAPSSLLSVGEVPTQTPGSAFTSSPSSFFSTTTLGGTTGNSQKITIFGGEDAANVSGLAIYRYRRSTGTNWTTDGFSFRQEVDNSAGIYDYINFAGGNVGIGTTNPGSKLTVSGSLSKSSGSFRIDHPLETKSTTHDLVHSFVEAPQADNIYRGKVDLVSGSATVNIDTVAGMTEGTFVALNREIQCFTTNESTWDAVKGSVSGNILTIECQNTSSTAIVSWMVIGERQDSHMYDTEWTDENGKVIVEPLKGE